jgi:hypothetical protein
MQKCHDQLIAYRFWESNLARWDWLIDQSFRQPVHRRNEVKSVVSISHAPSTDAVATNTLPTQAQPVAREQQVTRGTVLFCTLKYYKSENVF